MKRIFLGSLLISVLISSSYADNLVEVNILSTSDIHSLLVMITITVILKAKIMV